jgi:hypothetical protein
MPSEITPALCSRCRRSTILLLATEELWFAATLGRQFCLNVRSAVIHTRAPLIMDSLEIYFKTWIV